MQVADAGRFDAAQGNMNGATVIPEHEIAQAPLVAVDELGPALAREEGGVSVNGVTFLIDKNL